MQVATEPAETVEKESIPTLRFSSEDVLPTPAERIARRHDAERACALGNNYHGKLDIYFRTADGTAKRVQTTVWAVHEEYLTLKAGVSIPLRAVLGFDFY
ncbi:hypothetical protein F0P96_03355 [Hymenobacter busanensis]|uniref:Uncharacterized protein n=1 Tax=Hymenobacter busanensis TaxID=2607656 RepID=A0A7L4ZTX6_9BACT|nr:hypothetical protein [Hymenobacter busanensis]KAA9339664.1 hypothetical protein F0P96_03355 [Hymenobacter busanensis]QHJ06581.1 hypothetical protein GUY19_04395 [Hymenobacter busanensis]